MSLITGLLLYFVLVTLFLVGWHRWQTRMARLDAEIGQMLAKATPRIISAGVRPYPE